MSLRALWIDEGSKPEWGRLVPFTHLFLSTRDATTAALNEIRMRGFQAGIYRVTTWDEGVDDGKEWAKLLSDDVARCVGGDGRGLDVQLAVQADIEQHDSAFIVAFLKEWRARRPRRDTSWTMEGFQGGWMREIRQQINDSGVKLIPQAYDGAMKPFDSLGVVRELVNYGFYEQLIYPFHDAAELRRGWDGFAFTQQRLP